MLSKVLMSVKVSSHKIELFSLFPQNLDMHGYVCWVGGRLESGGVNKWKWSYHTWTIEKLLLNFLKTLRITSSNYKVTSILFRSSETKFNEPSNCKAVFSLTVSIEQVPNSSYPYLQIIFKSSGFEFEKNLNIKIVGYHYAPPLI